MAVTPKIPIKKVPVLIETEGYSHVPSGYRMCFKCLDYMFPVVKDSELECHKCKKLPHYIHIQQVKKRIKSPKK